MAMPKVPDPGPALPPLSYETRGRRDPFVAVRVTTDKAGLDVGTLKLAGIIRGRQPVALIEGPDGLGYILKSGDVLGNGRVTDITANSVSFAVSGRVGQRETNLTLKLATE
jgi:Tfp pilus assembly protein PilP